MRLDSDGWQTASLFRLVGYGLLLLALFDYVTIFIPPNFTNPVWEFQTIGALVEHVPIPLLGLILVFYGEANFRQKLEKRGLKFLSYFALVAGVLFLLLLPLGLNDTWRINTQNKAQVSSQLARGTSQLQQIKQQLSQASTPEDISRLFSGTNNSIDTPNVENFQEFRSQLLTEVDRTGQNLRTQAEAVQSNQRFNLFKNSAKWNLGALVSGLLFIRIWYSTRWARRKWEGK